MKSLFVLYLVLGTFFMSQASAQEPQLPPRVEQELDHAFDQMELFLRLFRQELPGVIERFEKLQEELEKPLPPRKPPIRKFPGRDI